MVDIDSREVSRLAVELSAAAQRVGADVAAVVRRSALQVERYAKGLAPVDTGALRGSITTSFEGDGRSRSMTAEIGPEVNYGRFVEAGTSRQAPQPYMGPALDRVAPGFEAALEKLTDPFRSP